MNRNNKKKTIRVAFVECVSIGLNKIDVVRWRRHQSFVGTARATLFQALHAVLVLEQARSDEQLVQGNQKQGLDVKNRKMIAIDINQQPF